MATINYAAREISVKIVYYGPGLSGKTTNLQIIHRKTPKDTRSDMVSLATETDRTLFFDFLPIDLGKIRGFTTKFQLYTVPGQIYYNATRKLVLRGVDGIVFVADSDRTKMAENIESYQNMEENLAEYGYNRETIPTIIQYNKRDLPNIFTVEELEAQLNKHKLPSSEAVAFKGDGVFESLKMIGKLVIDQLNKKYASPSRRRSSSASVAPQAAPAPQPQQQMPQQTPTQQVPIQPQQQQAPQFSQPQQQMPQQQNPFAAPQQPAQSPFQQQPQAPMQPPVQPPQQQPMQMDDPFAAPAQPQSAPQQMTPPPPPQQQPMQMDDPFAAPIPNQQQSAPQQMTPPPPQQQQQPLQMDDPFAIPQPQSAPQPEAPAPEAVQPPPIQMEDPFGGASLQQQSAPAQQEPPAMPQLHQPLQFDDNSGMGANNNIPQGNGPLQFEDNVPQGFQQSDVPTQSIPTQPSSGPASYGTIDLDPLSGDSPNQNQGMQDEFDLESQMTQQSDMNMGQATPPPPPPSQQNFASPQGPQGAEPLYFTSVDPNKQKRNIKKPVNPKFKPKTGIFNKFFNKEE